MIHISSYLLLISKHTYLIDHQRVKKVFDIHFVEYSEQNSNSFAFCVYYADLSSFKSQLTKKGSAEKNKCRRILQLYLVIFFILIKLLYNKAAIFSRSSYFFPKRKTKWRFVAIKQSKVSAEAYLRDPLESQSDILKTRNLYVRFFMALKNCN